ncbi:oxidoreductase [Malassezia pachydermatis]
MSSSLFLRSLLPRGTDETAEGSSAASSNSVAGDSGSSPESESVPPVIYGGYITYVLCAFVALGTLIHITRLIRERHPKLGLALAKVPVWYNISSLCRAIGYYRIQFGSFAFDPISYVLISLAVATGSIIWCFALLPHYLPSFKDGTPLLAIRAGLIGAGLLPFLFSFALKLNPVSILTGLSHAHLQFYHKCISVLFFFFGCVHTIPMIWQPLREAGVEGLHEFYTYNSDRIWSGAVCLFITLWMVCSSLGWFRKMAYEFFVLQHIVSIILLIIFLFIHFDDQLGSNNWLYATLAIWIFSIVGRSFMALFSTRFFRGGNAKIDILATAQESSRPVSGDMNGRVLRLSFKTPMKWKPGQHIYIRFPGLTPTQAHPFTITSLPNETSKEGLNDLVLFARVHKGITHKLYDHVEQHGTENIPPSWESRADSVEKQRLSHDVSEIMNHSIEPALTKIQTQSGLPTRYTTVKALVDGPYGYTYRNTMYEHNVYFAAGTGATYILPQMMDLLRRSIRGEAHITKSIRFIWSIRSFDAAQWARPELLELIRLGQGAHIPVFVEIYSTRDSATHWIDADLCPLEFVSGQRPNIEAVLTYEINEAMKSNSATMCVYACGTHEMNIQVSNFVAGANLNIAMGKLGSLHDLKLNSESFSF